MPKFRVRSKDYGGMSGLNPTVEKLFFKNSLALFKFDIVFSDVFKKITRR